MSNRLSFCSPSIFIHAFSRLSGSTSKTGHAPFHFLARVPLSRVALCDTFGKGVGKYELAKRNRQVRVGMYSIRPKTRAR